MKIGTTAPDFNLPGIDEQNHVLADFGDKEILIVVFTCNHCPYAQAFWPRLVKLQAEFKDKSVQFMAINANDAAQYPEDAFENMRPFAEARNVNFPYLRDEEQTVATAYGALCTPHVFLFDQERKLQYQGRVDDSWRDEAAIKRHDLKNAIEAALADRSPEPAVTPAMGCSIKWRA